MTAPIISEETKLQAYKELLELEFLPKRFYGLLSPMLREPCKVFDHDQDRETFLIAALPVCATLMRGAKMRIRKGEVDLNLAVWIHAPFGIGKGVAGMARLLVDQARSEAMEEYLETNAGYEERLKRYRAQQNIINRVIKEDEERQLIQEVDAVDNGHATAEQPRSIRKEAVLPEPEVPSKEDIILPLYGNVKTIRDHISDNDGHILFFDTEADSLHTSSGDYGDLRLIIKQGIENEKSSQVFKTTGLQEWTPVISLMIAATEDQLKKFIKGPHDGLFSRFLYYGFEGSQEWHSMRPKADVVGYNESIQRFQGIYAALYRAVKEAAPTVNFTDRMWDQHDEDWTLFKHEAINIHSALAGSIHRLGFFQLRIAAVLTIMHHFETKTSIESEIECDMHSWVASKQIIGRFLRGLYDTWAIYKEEELPTDQVGRGVDYKVAKVAAAKEAMRLKREENLTNVQVFDALRAEKEFTPYTVNWCSKLTLGARKTEISRLLKFVPEDDA